MRSRIYASDNIFNPQFEIIHIRVLIQLLILVTTTPGFMFLKQEQRLL